MNMNREIKFRAWCKQREEWIDIRRIFFNECESSYVEDYDGEIYFPERKDWELMQFTGLKDKNGVEIYEGDIVEITHPFRQRYHVGEVIYDGYCFNVKGFWFTHYDVPNDAFSEGCGYTAVIGNICENPEWLEVEL